MDKRLQWRGQRRHPAEISYDSSDDEIEQHRRRVYAPPATPGGRSRSVGMTPSTTAYSSTVTEKERHFSEFTGDRNRLITIATPPWRETSGRRLPSQQSQLTGTTVRPGSDNQQRNILENRASHGPPLAIKASDVSVAGYAVVHTEQARQGTTSIREPALDVSRADVQCNNSTVKL